MLQEFVDPYEKRADCQEDYISPPYQVPAADVSGSSTESTSGDDSESATV